MTKFVSAAIASVENLTGRMRRIRLAGDGIGPLKWTPGQQIRVVVARGDKERVLRTYSVWDRDGDTLDLCVFDHPGNGPGARWARNARLGQEVKFTKPEGKFVLREDAPYYVFVGEETAAVAFGPMLRALPESAQVRGAIEVDTEADRIPLPWPLTWCLRDGAGAAKSKTLLDAVKRLDLDGKPGVAYVAGEARTVQSVRKYLKRELDWPKGAVVTKPFWTPGKTGLH